MSAVAKDGQDCRELKAGQTIVPIHLRARLGKLAVSSCLAADDQVESAIIVQVSPCQQSAHISAGSGVGEDTGGFLAINASGQIPAQAAHSQVEIAIVVEIPPGSGKFLDPELLVASQHETVGAVVAKELVHHIRRTETFALP